MSIPDAVLGRLKDAVGAKGFSTDPNEIAPHLEEWRGKYHGHSALLLKPATTAEVSAILRICHETGTADRHPGRQYRAGGRADSAAWRSAAVHPKAEQDPGHRRRRHDLERRGRCHPGPGSGTRRGKASAVSPQPGLGRQLHHRRQHRHQCRRHPCAALWHDPRPGAGAGSGAGGRHGAAHAARPAQGQYRLRPQADVHRQRRHLGRDHGGDSAAVPQAGCRRHRVRGGTLARRRSEAVWARCRRAPAACCRPSS